MLTRKEIISPQQRYYSDSLLTLPSTSHTIFNNFAAGVATPILALNDLNSTFSQKPEGRAMHEALSAIEMENQTPGMGWGQWGANQVANLVGMGVNPVMWGFGEIGGLAVKGVGVAAEKIAPNAVTALMRKPLSSSMSLPLAKYLPEQIGREGEKKTLSAGLVSQKTLDTFGTFAGAGVPIGIVQNFDLNTGHINWGGVARDAGEMGAFGIAIGSVPFAWGVLRGKINRAAGELPSSEITPGKLNQALENGQITPIEHKWYVDYLEHQKNPQDENVMADLQTRATHIINDNGHDVNIASNEASFNILTPKDVEHINAVVPDQLIANIPQEFRRTALSDFLIHNRLDEIRNRPGTLDGVRGYIDHIKQKLSVKPSQIEAANRILDEHLLKGIKENMPFSQKEMLKHMRQSGFESSHMSQLPIVIPENMKFHVKQLEKIEKLKEKIKKYGENKQTEKRIEELTEKLPKILTPKEELEHIRSKLITEKGLKKDWERSNEYHRLMDLAHVWHNAKTLLDRIHLERDYERQEAYATLSEEVVSIADSDLPRLAKPENVIDYLKARIKGSVYQREPIEGAEIKAIEATQVPSDPDQALAEQEMQVKNSYAQDLAKEFTDASDRFKEFKSSESVFKNLIACVLGGMNGKG